MVKSSVEGNITSNAAIEVVVDSIAPWVKRFEDEADYKLFGQNRQGYYTKMNMNALLRGDHQSRATFYQALSGIGAISPNDIRGLEDMNKIPDGDIYTMQSQNVTLEQIKEGVNNEPMQQSAPTDDAVAARRRFQQMARRKVSENV